ncbi:MAG: DEAD/DEAH box helicase family protein [bacterium]|nr:DEAD/DEAH box helicase family protein [bacterium]MDY4098864.1 DEAD/DEAH box helicase family protein [Lachnospiraceae bacterium]
MEYLADRLGDSFKQWGNGTCEFIDAQTGCGKTTFILSYVLPYMAEHKMKILYLVNRSILQQQLEEDIINQRSKERYYIDVMTYQNLENQILKKQYENEHGEIYEMRDFLSYDCVICDECHYFLSDATYNSNTFLSFIWIIENFYHKIRVYMSATIADVRVLVEAYNKNFHFQRTNYLRLNTSSYQESCQRYHLEQMREQNRSKRNYPYITVKVFRKLTEIIESIDNKQKEKWLIFVNDIFEARNLKRKIKKVLEGEEVDQIDASYDLFDDTIQIVDDIVRNRTFSGRVLIATSVLDNGISLEDSSIKNVVISIDNENEFIQMLGRIRCKSEEDKKQLFIDAQSLKSFSDRLGVLKRRKEYADFLYKEYIAPVIYETGFLNYTGYYCLVDTVRLPDNNVGPVRNTFATGEEAKRVLATQKTNGHIRYNVNEQQMIWFMHSRIMRDLREKKVDYDTVSSICFIANGQFYFSRLAYEQIQLQIDYYNRMYKAMQEDSNAFVKEQLSWINKLDAFKSVIMDELEKAKNKLEQNIDGYFLCEKGEKVSAFDMEQFEKDNKDAYKILIDNLDVEENERQKMWFSVYKTDRSMSVAHFNNLAKQCNLKYCMEIVDKKKIFRLI